MALSHLGNFGTVNDIDDPKNSKEITFALWYDVTRKAILRTTMPNFSLSRRVVAKKSITPAFGYPIAYEYPSDCLKVLGFGEIDEKNSQFTVESDENDEITIFVPTEVTAGLQLRFIRDVEDVSRFTSDFKIMLSAQLAANVALDITQDLRKATKIEKSMTAMMLQLSGIQAQENPPIRKSISKFKQARRFDVVRNNEKL